MLAHAIVESLDHVCCRYRLRPFQRTLASANHSLQLQTELPSQATELLIIQRWLPNWWDRRKLKHLRSPLWFDFDDAIWSRDSYSAKGYRSHKREHRFRKLMQLCTGVSAGNRFLAEAAREANPRLQIQVVPTCVEVQRYSLAEHLDGSSTLVWIGSASTLQGLERIRPLLESLGEALPELKLKLICNRFLKLNCLEVIESPWSEATETLELASSDIGISWIPDDPWSRGKCGLKVLQYMAAGLPVVANRVGVHPEMIQHGVSGFLAESPEEWLEAIRLLARDPELRRKMGQAGRQIVEERYSIEAGTQAWATIFVTLAGKMRRTA